MEQTLTKQNFFGKDQIQWWLGIVVDPEKGKWERTIKYQKTQDGNEVYYYRARVRILGYHDSDQDLPDDQLPFAQVLGPANQSLGIGGEGDLLGLQGGETVLGFFLDGEDGQQPVIFGTLYRNRFVKDSANGAKKTAFEPFTPPSTVKGKHVIDEGMQKGQPWVGGVSDNESRDEITLSKTEYNVLTDVLITPPDPCEKNGLGRISSILQQFILKMTRWKLFAGTYYDALLGKIIDVRNELVFVSSEIFAQFTEWTRKIREEVMIIAYDNLAKLLLTVPKPQHPLFGKAIKILTDNIFCLFEKIIAKLFDYIFNSLTNFIGKVADFTTGIIDSFVGDFFGQLASILQTGLDVISGFLDLGISVADTIQSTIGGALGFLTNMFSCDNVGCRLPQGWSSRYGTIDLPRDSSENFSKIFKTKSYKKRTSTTKTIEIVVKKFAIDGTEVIRGEYDGDYVLVQKLYYLNVNDRVVREGDKNNRGTNAFYNKKLKTGIVFDSNSRWYIVTNVELINGSDLVPASIIRTKWGLAETNGIEHPNTSQDADYGRVTFDSAGGKITEFSGTQDTDILPENDYGNTYRVSPPQVIFNGQSKNSAQGIAMVNPSGEIVGVAITNSGSYKKANSNPPLITFYDKSNNGFGAGAVPVMGKVRKVRDGVYKPDPEGKDVGVVGVVMISNGKGYADRESKFIIGE